MGELVGETVSHYRIEAPLGVRGVVTGTVARRGGDLVVAAELVETDSGDQLWGEKFSRPASDLFGAGEAPHGAAVRGAPAPHGATVGELT